VRADYSAEEQRNIQRYNLGAQVIYNSQAAKKHLEHAGAHLNRTQSGGTGERAAGLARGLASLALAKMHLNISIASLGRGHHIECKDLEELLEAEETVREACKGVTRYLDVAATFDGSQVVIDYDKGEERVHITQSLSPLIEYHAEVPNPSALPPPSPTVEQIMGENAMEEIGRDFRRLGMMIQARWLAIEAKLTALAHAKGWDADKEQIRLVCGIAASVALLLLFEIF